MKRLAGWLLLGSALWVLPWVPAHALSAAAGLRALELGLRLLKLPPDIQIAVRDNRISMGHARAIINVENPDQQLYIFKKTLEEDLSVRKLEALVRELASARKTDKGTSTTAAPANREINQLQSKLSSHFGTRIVIKRDGKKGEIKIPFLSVEDLNRILDILKIQ